VKTTTVFSCQNCGAQSPKWLGQCPECGHWGTMVEEVIGREEKGKSRIKGEAAKLVRIDQIKEGREDRTPTGIGELDRVLGGGIVPGSVVLFAGEPGIGKSTLLTQIALRLRSLTPIYISGEESPQQVRLRIGRLRAGKKESSISNPFFLAETDVDLVIDKVQGSRFKNDNLLLIVDSIQTLTTTDLSGVAGSISQVRESTQRLIELAKKKRIPVFLVGHVTKKGLLAGPKTIEHAVDTVLYFEGERSGDLRLLRSVKNRFGPTDEVGVFQMTDKGLIEVKNPSLVFLGEGFLAKKGSAYGVVFEGTRPMVVEVQALVTESFAPMPKRVVNGLERKRSEMLIAVLQKHLRLPLWEYDVFLNVAGGLKISEPGADLAACAALLSSYKNKAFAKGTVFVGEVSLLGEVGQVGGMEKRKRQAQALGFKRFLSSSQIKRIGQLRSLLK